MELERFIAFQADMNADGVITISDMTAWATWLFFYPGDFIIYIVQWLIGSGWLHRIAIFFEYDPSASWYGGWIGGIYSALFWGQLILFPWYLKDLHTWIYTSVQSRKSARLCRIWVNCEPSISRNGRLLRDQSRRATSRK